MRILYFLQVIAPSAGGGEALFYSFIKNLSRKGHEVHVICNVTKNLRNDVQSLLELGVKFHTIKPEIGTMGTVVLTYRQHISYIINAIRMGRKVLKCNKFDIIHANTYTPVIPALVLGKISKIPVMMTVHHVSLGHWKVWSSQKGISRSASIVGPVYERIILGIPVQVVHTVSNSTQADLLNINPNAKVSTLYNGIDLKDYIATTYRYQKFILYIGRIVSTKNLGVVILAFSNVIKSFPAATLVIVGNGPMREEWERLARIKGLENNVDFVGHVSEYTKQKLLGSCSALVLPSKMEGFGRVIIEAFAMYKPVLVSSIRSLSEVVENGKDGFLIPPDNFEMWAERIKFLLANTEACRKMGENGRKKVEEKFNLKIISNKIEELYLSTASKKKG
jgi:glycosyltransferase involved in cell wall biosynthesis